MCYLGATYERETLSEVPDLITAKNILFPKIQSFFPEVGKLEVVNCRAALRAVPKGHYFPIVSKVKDKLWVIAAMGSRGLLYHAYLGKLLAIAIINKEELAFQDVNLV
jgi:glycine/D-amino acid oxidase-like deaminating enzyme